LTQRLRAVAAVLWKPALLLAGLAAAGLALRSGAGRQALEAPAQLGPPGFVAVAALAAALGVPRQVVAYAAGLGFGIWEGGALALAAQGLGCAADFVWARAVARNWAARRMRGRLARLDAMLAKHPFSATFTLRLLPVGSNVALNLLAGVSGVAAAPFLAASVLGYVPQTLVFGLLGAGVSVGHGTQIAVAVGLFVAASGLGVWLLWRRRVGQGAALDPPEDARPLDTY
jgi:uncharacterized membrane protein YdjX (TVP38/TMEM64 family)